MDFSFSLFHSRFSTVQDLYAVYSVLFCQIMNSCASFPAKIQSMKNAVPKNDKKKRKQLTEEIAKLEADLSQKHEEEIRQLKPTTDTKVKSLWSDDEY